MNREFLRSRFPSALAFMQNYRFPLTLMGLSASWIWMRLLSIDAVDTQGGITTDGDVALARIMIYVVSAAALLILALAARWVDRSAGRSAILVCGGVMGFLGTIGVIPGTVTS